MNGFDPVTLARLRYLVPGASADDYAAAVLDLNTSLGTDVLATPELKKGTELRTRLAMQDTAIAFNAIASILTSMASTEEQRENLVFLLAKAIDDSLNLGAFYMAGRPKDDLPPPVSISDIARKGGTAPRKPVEDWQAIALPLARKIREEHPRSNDSFLIKELVKRYGSKLPKLPGERQLQTWVSRWVSFGKLDPGATDGRSKKVTKPTSRLPK